jgi:acyl carrier protein
MIPSTFVILDALPLGAGGKVDRNALPVPSDTRPELATPFIAPRTPVEKNLAEIWAALLSLDRVGIHDNFFDLGGHSLLATRVISRVIDHFQLALPIQLLFQSPTIADMAGVITEIQAKRLSESDLSCILSDLESLSEKDAQLLLADNHKASTGTKGSDGGF